MSRFDDIQYGQADKLVLDKNEGEFSPHQLDLREISSSRPAHDYKLNDVKAELSAGLKKSPLRYEERQDHSVKIATRFAEGMRMMTVGVTVVFLLNVVGVYYQGMKLKNEVATAAYTSYESIVATGPSRDAFQSAESQFNQIQEQLWFLQSQKGDLRDQGKAVSALSSLLGAGEQLTRAGDNFLQFVEEAKAVSGKFFEPKIVGQSATGELSEAYDRYFVPALVQLSEANEQIQDIRPKAFPGDLQPTIENAQGELAELTHVLSEFDARFPLLLQFLGDKTPQRYLVLLENNNESRPGGGFIGSYMIVDLNDGYLDGMTFHDVYDLDNRYHKEIPPPGEVARLTNNWRFRDSNYSPDMTVSAAKAAWFLEEEGGPGVDHVVTVDLEFVSRLLELTGPIKIDALPIALASDNFDMVLSYMVEAKLSGATTPKQVLSEFIDEVQLKLKEEKPWGSLFQLMQEMARSKHIALYSEDPTAHSFLTDFGLSGAFPVRNEREDTFMVVHTTIGNKTDTYINQDITHRTTIHSDGALTDTVSVTRTHRWNDFERLRLKNLLASFNFTEVDPWLIDLLGGAPNTSIMRVYVPHGARLVSASGLNRDDIQTVYDEDLDLDYFTFSSTVQPNSTTSFELSYQLPYELSFMPLDEYRLNVVKQPSDENTTFTKIMEGGVGLNHYRSFPEQLLENAHEQGIGIYTWSTDLNQDLHVAQLWGE